MVDALFNGRGLKECLKVGICAYQAPEDKEVEAAQVGDIIVMDGSHGKPVLTTVKEPNYGRTITYDILMNSLITLFFSYKHGDIHPPQALREWRDLNPIFNGRRTWAKAFVR